MKVGPWEVFDYTFKEKPVGFKWPEELANETNPYSRVGGGRRKLGIEVGFRPINLFVARVLVHDVDHDLGVSIVFPSQVREVEVHSTRSARSKATGRMLLVIVVGGMRFAPPHLSILCTGSNILRR